MKSLWLRTVIVAAVLGGAGAAVWQYQRGPLSRIPAIDLSRSSPSVRQAIEKALQEVRASPRSGRAWGELGLVLQAHDFSRESELCLTQAEAFDPQEMLWPYIRGVGLQAEHPDRAEAAFRRAIELAPDEPLCRLRLAELLLKRRDYEAANRLLDEVLARDPRSGRAMLGKATILLDKGNVVEALAWAQKANQAAPKQRAIVQILADTSRRLGKTDQAARWVAALKTLPAETRWDDPHVAGVLELRQDPSWLAVSAERLAAEGRLSEARELLERAVADEPDTLEWRTRLARILLRQNELDQASRLLEQDVKRGADSADLQFLLGIIHYARGEWSQSADRLQKALRHDPKNAQGHFNLGQAERALKRTQEARDEYQRALELDPGLHVARLALAEVLLEEGDTEAAHKQLHEILAREPAHEAARKLLKKTAK